eukprot:144320_1
MASTSRSVVEGYMRQELNIITHMNDDQNKLSRIVHFISVFAFGKQDSIKLLFLDVDGVLNTVFDNGLRDDLIQHLAHIIDETKCKIILSTTWRLKQHYKDQLFDALTAKGQIDIGNVYLGDTPLIGNGFIRAFEIESCLSDMNMFYNVISWVAIDDTELNDPPVFDYSQRFFIKNKCQKFMNNHFVKTSDNQGLTKRKMNDAIRILNPRALQSILERGASL